MNALLDTVIAKIDFTTTVLAQSTKGDPLKSIFVVFLFYFAFTVFEGFIEKVAWGDRFVHWLDPVISGLFIGYAGWAVWACCLYQTRAMQ